MKTRKARAAWREKSPGGEWFPGDSISGTWFVVSSARTGNVAVGRSAASPLMRPASASHDRQVLPSSVEADLQRQLAPGLPRTNAQGLAQGEPRGQRERGSNRGLRLAGWRPWYASSGVLPPSHVCGRQPLYQSAIAVKLPLEGIASVGHQQQASEKAFHRQDEALHDGNADRVCPWRRSAAA